MRRRRPAPAVVRQRCAVKSVRQETVLSLSTIGFARLRLPLAVTVALSLWTPIRCSSDGVTAAG